MARSARRPAAEARDHVLSVVEDLFYWRGIRATGVDVVAAEAGIAPTTLYRLFASKDDLVAAYVDRAAQRYRDRFAQVLADAGPSPRAQIRAVFDALITETEPELCRGCLFQLALGEVPDKESAAHQGATQLKGWVRDQLGTLTAQLAAEQDAETRQHAGTKQHAATKQQRAGTMRQVRAQQWAEALADDLMLVMEGVYGSMGSFAERRPARRARVLAERLLSAEG